MALNELIAPARHISVVCSDPTTPASGGPVRWGSITGIAIIDETADGKCTIDISSASYNLSVKGVNDSGNSAVADGDSIFYVDADTPKLSKKSSGYFFGIARAAVGSGLTATIEVLHIPSPGSGTLGTGTVGTTNLAAGAVTAAKIGATEVTAAKLTTTLATGFIPLPLAQARLLSANDIAAKNATDGGLVSLDTDPTYKRVNGATDKKARIAWAATSVVEIVWDFAYPPDLDDTAAVTVNLLMAMAGATNTPVIGVSYFENVGDTNAGGNTAAVTGTTLAKYAVTIAASDVGAYPAAAAIGLVPAAHGTDAIYLYGAWIEYTRK